MRNENMDLFVRARMTDFLDHVNLYIGRFNKETRKVEIVKEVTFTEDEEFGTISIPPTVSLTPESAQQLMDELWKCGLRPVEGKGSAGSLAATESHLQDFRKIAFKFLELE